MPKRAVFEKSRRGLSLDVSAGVHILLLVEQSSLESQSRGCAKTVNTDTYGDNMIRKVQRLGGGGDVTYLSLFWEGTARK